MTTGFAGDVFANLVGTFVGAALALLGAAWVKARAEKKSDQRLLQAVIYRLWRARALREARVGAREESPAVKLDRERCALSVLTARDQIASVNDGLALRKRGSKELDKMYLACLRYLRSEKHAPTLYVNALMALRAELQEQVDELCDMNKNLEHRIVGNHDLENRNEYLYEVE